MNRNNPLFKSVK